MLFALAMMAQTAIPQGGTAPAAPAAGDKAGTCACCSGDKCPMMKDGKMAEGATCCGKDGGCCKDGKCDIAAHKDGKMAKSCCGDNCCKDGKCAMAANTDSKGGCCGDKCPMMKGAKSATKSGKDKGCCEAARVVSCCKTGAACCKNGNLPCCDAGRVAA
jgi:hypothetical protein